MLELRAEKLSGVLSITTEGVGTLVYLLDGAPVYAEETHGETLGRLLLRLKRITREQYGAVIAKMATVVDTSKADEPTLFGDAAVALGTMTEAEAARARLEHVRWRIIRAFQRSELTCKFDECRSAIADAGGVPMAVEALVLEALRWVDDERKLELGLGAVLDQIVTIDPAAMGGLAERFELTTAERDFAFRVDGTKTALQLLTDGAKDVDVHAVLAAMVMTGDVTAVRSGPAMVPRGRSETRRIVRKIGAPGAALVAEKRRIKGK